VKDRAASLAPLVLMLVLAAVTFLLYRAVQSDTPQGPLRHDPDYIVEQFTVRRFDVNGHLQHTIIAAKMEHFPDDDTSVVTTPHLLYHRQPPTEVFAKQALVSKDGKEVDLVGDVKVIRHGVAGAADTVMETRLLKMFPDDETATTTTPVVITKGQSIVNGSGLDFNNATGITVLYGRVTATLYRNPAK
jgi:lipopolysaccharide export system protein LptC